MSAEKIKAEEFWNPEHIVETFWNGLKEGVIYARKCEVWSCVCCIRYGRYF